MMRRRNLGLRGPVPALLLAAALALAATPTTRAQAPSETSTATAAQTAALDALLPVSPDVIVGRLDNGLTYYIRANGRPEGRAELRLAVNAGSVLEDDDQLGLAHFVEHMAFNGTEHFAKDELVRFMESIGMRLGPHVNAYTSFDETVYMLQVPTDTPEPMATGFQILEDWAHGVTFEDEEIDKERGVVVEEWRLGQGAFARVRDRQLPVLFSGSRYADRLPIGTKESIESAPYAALRRFYHDWYRPDLMAVIAVGDFAPDDVERLVVEHFEGLASPAGPRVRPTYDVPDHEGTRFAVATDPELPGASVSVQRKLELEEERTVGAYRRSLVERLYASMFNDRLRELTQQADPPFVGGGGGKGRMLRSQAAYSLSASVEPSGILRGLDVLLTEAERVDRFGFTEGELDRAKRSMLRGMERAWAERANRQSASHASELVRAFLSDEPIPGIEYELVLARRFLPEIELADVDRIADGWWGPGNRVILVSAPELEDVEPPDEPALLAVIEGVETKDLTAYEDTVADRPLLAALPAPGEVVQERTLDALGATEWRLANGALVVLMPTDYRDDEIVLRAVSPGGTSLAGDDEIVAAAAADQVVPAGGLGELSRLDLQKMLAGKAATVQPMIARYQEGLAGGASPKDLETLFQLIHLTFTAPRADPEVFQSLISRMRTMLANQDAMPQAVFGRELQRILTQGHPRATGLSVESLEDYDLERSLAFYEDRFADAGDFTFIFVGKLDLEAMRPLVETYIGSLPATGRTESWRDEGIRRPDGVMIRKVFKGLEPQSQTRLLFSGPFEYERQNRTTIRAMAQVLQTKLRDRLREELGATYGVNVGASYEHIPQERYSISIGFGSDPERVDELLEDVFLAIETLKTEGPSEGDVADVRESMLRSYETDTQSNTWWSVQLAYKYEEGSDPADIVAYPESIAALTPEMIQEAARMYFDLRNYVQATLYPEVER